MAKVSASETINAVYPTIIAAGAALCGTNPFRLPKNSWEFTRFQYQAAMPFALYLNSLCDTALESNEWKKEAKKAIFKIPGDLASELIERVSLMDLCPAAGEREEMVVHYKTASRGLYEIDPFKDYPVISILQELMAVRFPRFLYDYRVGVRIARQYDRGELSATAFSGVSKNFLCQISVDPDHFDEDGIAHFSIGFAEAAKMINEVFTEAYQHAPAQTGPTKAEQ